MTPQGASPTEYRLEDGIGWITLNRPEKRNALDVGLVGDLGETLKRAGNDSRVRVVVISGAGPDFSAGADLAALERMADAPVMDNLRDADALAEVFLRIRQLDQPVIAAVHGHALGGGAGLATACDIVLASASATFGYTEIRLGFVPAIVMTILRRNTSEKRAYELLTGGEIHPAAKLEAFGIINRVLPDENFEAGVLSYARDLAAKSRSALALTKRHLYGQDGMTYEAAIRAGAVINTVARMTDDTREGIERFLSERRSAD